MKIKARLAFVQILLVMLFVVATVAPQPAKAQFVDPVTSVNTTIKNIFDKLTDALKEAYFDAAAAFWNNGVQMFVNKLAQDTAVWVASGDKGQKPLLFTNDWGKYLQNAGENALASSAIAFADAAGIGNICVSPQVAIDIIIPTLNLNVGGRPKCTLDQIRKAWDVTDPKFLENFTFSFYTNQNDLGVSVNWLTSAQQNKAAAEQAAQKERETSVFKDVKGFINNLTETPAPLVEKQIIRNQELNTANVTTYTGRLVADSIRVFATTLAGQYLNKLKNGFFSARDLLGEETNSRLNELSSLLDVNTIAPSGSDKAQVQFVGYFKPDLKQANNFDVIAQFSSCTSEIKYASIFNCVLDSGFVSALQASGEDGYLTVQQAVQKGLLHGEWSFGFIDPGAGIEPSYLNGYAYSNMKKMRRVRIIPVGWELAALRARQRSERVTLNDMLASFDDEASPYYHLVDPNWVLKVPDMRCGAQAPGQIVQPDSPERAQTCVDIQDCVSFGSDGECLAWGYCTNEKRAWAFPAQKCAEQFATCEQLVEPGESTNNFWLTKTLDYKGCTAESSGCTWYSLSKDAAGDWVDTDRIYLNGQAKECDKEDAGCHAYVRMVNGSNLLRNSSFEDDAGHNYVLANGDQTADNGIPDGWAARSVTVALNQDQPRAGVNTVQVKSQNSAGVCNPALQYTAPLGSFEPGQSYVLSGFVRQDQSSARDIRISFQNLNFTVKTVTNSWTPFSFSFVMPATSNSYTLLLGTNNGDCNSLNTDTSFYFDAIQLEKGTKATTFASYASRNVVHLKNAPSCSFEDVGCQTYQPENDAKNSINGVITGANLCPSECVGYDTYEKQATDTDPARFENFIPDTARTCSAAEVGCQEFTNLDVVAKGGEGLEYYAGIRHCEKPQPQCSTFYTWEGSDVSGFQLATYELMASSSNGSGEPKTTDGSSTCDPKDTDCRELIAKDGSRSFRKLTKTITCSEACVPLRAGPDTVTQAECATRLGEWDTTTNRCVFHVIPSESRSCSAKAAGCREYVGNTGSNVAVVFNDTFEDGDAAGWATGSVSTEATTVGGHSLKLGGAVSTIAVSTSILTPDVTAGKGYEIQLDAKASVSDFITVTAWLGSGKTNAERLGAFVTGTTQWNNYKLGPLTIPANAQGPFKLIFDISGSSSKSDAINLFIDNITVRQLKSSLYLVRNSWQTPNTCDIRPTLPNGSASRTMLGCKAYTIAGDQSDTTVNATGFARLCAKEKVGCEAVIDTFNSGAPYREIFQAGDEAEVTVPEDRVRYIINRPEFNCEPELRGCMEVGKPELDLDGNVTGYTPTYLINNPDDYNKILCKGESLFCRTYQTSSNSVIYAKNPGKQQCEYRAVKNVYPPRSAWFKVGDTSEEENPQECLDAETNSFVRTCGQSEVSCTQFVEPITQESYFYRKNTMRDNSAQCNGVVDWKKGCVLFDDISNRSKLFKSGEDEDFTGAPTACQTNDAGCNTNMLLRVSLDRQCSQWLTGVSTGRYYDPASSQYKSNSYSLGRCIEADPVNPTICRKWDNSTDKPALTTEVYRDRDVSWAGEEYSGYSIPNEYPVETLRQRSISTDEDGNPSNFRLTHLSDPGATCRTNADCAPNVCRLSLNPTTGNFEGRCYEEQGLDNGGTIAAPECRGYPEADSPFPYTLAQFATDQDDRNPNQIISKNPLFKNANIGENGEDVECSYHKAFYSGQTRYYSIDSYPPSKIKVDGTESNFTRKDTFIGWEGYCLERDSSRQINGDEKQNACLTWYPVDIIQGALDVNSSARTAGYNVATDRESYCVESTFAEYRKFFRSCEATCPSGYVQAFRSQSATCANGRHYRYCEPVNGEGWYVHDGQLNGFEAQYGIQQMCTKVARIASPDGTNRAWTTRILGQQLPGAKIWFVSDIQWGPQQQNVPYGAASTRVPRLEDLNDPLLVKNPNTFVDCKQCKVAEGEVFGTCQDDNPSLKDHLCQIAPNAGSPYAFSYDLNTSQINNENIKVRRDNKLPTDEDQPYPKSEDFTAGFSRLSELFAKSYGVYQWQSVRNVCVGVCQGGLSDGESCETDSACGDPDTTIKYTCVGNNSNVGTCVGGYKDSQTCSANADCQAPRENKIHQCVQITGPDQDPNNPTYQCESGPFQGRDCTSKDDCDETKADGVCSFAPRCQAKDASGNVILSANSGKFCNSDAECNAQGTCRVNRCSTEAPGTNSGVCSGKKAGDVCGEATKNNQYVRIPANNPAVGWDIVKANPAGSQPPLVRPTVPDSTSPSGFQERSITGFSINGSSNGNIGGVGGRLPVAVTFYAYNENGEQMPLKVVMVDWGDGSDPAQSRGSFKNHKHACRSFCSNAVGIACKKDDECKTDAEPNATCQPYNFGDSAGACTDDSSTTNGYFTFSYTYNCEGDTACTYKPSVLVKDNWGATTRVAFPGQIIVQPAS